MMTVPTTSMAAQPTVNLGTTTGFTVLAGSTITNTGVTTINGSVGGDIGLYPGIIVTPPVVIIPPVVIAQPIVIAPRVVITSPVAVTPTVSGGKVVTSTVAGGQLLKTSTPLYELLLIGVALTLFGALGFRSRKRFE